RQAADPRLKAEEYQSEIAALFACVPA
ncbi:MAG: hypothetical protein RLZZ253_3113, partial [Verrucomicrobiota bacterium]